MSIEPGDAVAGDAVAVIGLSCRFPGAPDPDAFWRLLRDGGDAVREVPPERSGLGAGVRAGFLDRAVSKGKVTDAEREEALARISFVTDLGRLADRQLVIEAIREQEQVKVEIFTALDAIVEDQDAILASNTSSVPIVRLARATSRASHVVGIHFFNPVPELPLVELVGSVLTDARTQARAEEFVTGVLGKQAIRSPDRAGFVVNALLFPYLNDAVKMLEASYASADDIDHAMKLGCGYPMGPFELLDVVGLDVALAIQRELYLELREPSFAPAPLLEHLVTAGYLGRKVGRGFRDYR